MKKRMDSKNPLYFFSINKKNYNQETWKDIIKTFVSGSEYSKCHNFFLKDEDYNTYEKTNQIFFVTENHNFDTKYIYDENKYSDTNFQTDCLGFALVENAKILNICAIKMYYKTYLMKHIINLFSTKQYPSLIVRANMNNFVYYLTIGFQIGNDLDHISTSKRNKLLSYLKKNNYNYYDYVIKKVFPEINIYDFEMILDLNDFDMALMFTTNFSTLLKNIQVLENSFHFFQYSKDSFEDYEWKNFMNKVREWLFTTCNYEVGSEYIANLTIDAKFSDVFVGVTNWDNQKEEKRSNNFAIAIAEKGKYKSSDMYWYENDPEYMYIELVCADKTFKNTGIGSALMDYIVQKSKDDGIKYICLSAIVSAIGFYLKLGYELAFHCETDDQKISLTSQIKELFQSQSSNPDFDAEFLELMYEAVRRGLGVSTEMCIKSPTENCLMDGLYMILCIEKNNKQLVLSPNPSELFNYYYRLKRKNDSNTLEITPSLKKKNKAG